MTTIAWDGKVLAADKCSTGGYAKRKVRKVFRIPDHRVNSIEVLAAFSGSAAFSELIRRWISCGGEWPDPEKYVVDRDTIAAYVVLPHGAGLQALTAAGGVETFEEPFFAGGGGHEVAWGALEAGASAVEAIRIAHRRSVCAGMGIDWVGFDPALDGSIDL